MFARGGASGFFVLPGNRVDDALMLFLYLLGEGGPGRFVAAGYQRRLGQKVEQEFDQWLIT